MSEDTEKEELASDEAASDEVVDSASQALDEAEAAIESLDQPTESGPEAFRLESLVGEEQPPEKCSIELLRDVDLDLKIELGRTHMLLEDVLQLRQGSVVTLDKLAGDPVDLFVNGRLVAKGEILVLNDNFCVRIAELIGSDALIE
jgi:flagellar motor switch protein FliN/FliY